MKWICSLLLLCLFSSCVPGNDKSSLIAFETKEEDFVKYVNQKTLPTSPNLSLDKTIINNEYPIEIALYQDGKFYYNLPNLGDGNGTWTFRNGKIRLFAERRLFDMHIMIKALEEGANSVGIEFADRFGPQFLKMQNSNLP